MPVSTGRRDAGVSSSGTMSTFLGCSYWQSPSHVVYHVASGILLCGLLVPDSKHGDLMLHGTMSLGFLLMSMWSWLVLCAPDVFAWNMVLLLLHGLQTASILYKIRPVKFSQDLEDVYDSLFRPLRVSRILYKRLVSPQFCALMTLEDGESYAVQAVTRTDKLGLLISGVMQAYSHQNLLHAITERSFIDSPEFESTLTGEETFQVSIVASGTCRYLVWSRQSLEYLLRKEPYLACVMKTLIGRDITNKLYALNEKVATPAGSRMDIRLPSISSNARQRRDLRRALAGAMEYEVRVTGTDEVTDSDVENDLGKPSEAGECESHLFVCLFSSPVCFSWTSLFVCLLVL
ncbi:unnamed protein product [Candidula unifasciata]|uniref:POPDC1-3 domain-containing protein n=1 Tax=Candidula unifasciata TaxID=100452 RepID=A0A8S3ZTI8_9EUPU|nr:unnamed protein product [Candidula unifasciata]